MDSQARNNYPCWTEVNTSNGSMPKPGTAILAVMPLNAVAPSQPVEPIPVDPSPPVYRTPKKKKAESSSSASDISSGPSIADLPAMVFYTSRPTTEEWNNVVSAVKKGVVVTGSAAKGKAGPGIGSVDISESEDDYLFRVSLPGVVRDANVFACDVQPDGAITVQGKITSGGKKVRRDSMTFRMQSENLCTPGEFSLSFRLPGPINNDHPIEGVFGTDGIFEAIVRKKAPTKKVA